MSHPAPIAFDSLPCPACGERLADDPDGTRCTSCGGVLVHRTWAMRAQPELGKPSLSPAYVGDDRTRTCAVCQRAMGPVLCHGVLAWSCARCRFLFFDGDKHRALTQPHSDAPRPAPPRTLRVPSLLRVTADRAREASPHIKDALAILALAALIIAAVILELRPT